MFDASMGELILVFVIGLLILGPERLPRVAAQIGRWVAKARRTANQLRYQLEREVALEEMYKAQKKKPRPAAKSTAETSAEPRSSASTEPDGSDTPRASASSDPGTVPDSHGASAAPASGGSTPDARPEESSAASAARPAGTAAQPDDGGREADWPRETGEQDLAEADVTEAAVVRESSAR